MSALRKIVPTGIEPAGSRVLRIVKPEADVERVDWLEAHIRISIKAENLVEQNGSDDDVHLAFVVGPEVRLVPSQTEASKAQVPRRVRPQIAAPDGEEIELKPRL